ncbi:All-trans-phytoene synthase [Anoxybacillus sp. BCO1]|nr:All-trans-phytoene synthase [Anoxybacillus sp. BCO1]
MNVKQAYAQCEAVTAYHSKTFYRAFSLLPYDDRQAIWAIYAFCRRVDDIVDEGEQPDEQLQQFEKQWEAFVAGIQRMILCGSRFAMSFRAMIWTLNRFGI